MCLYFCSLFNDWILRRRNAKTWPGCKETDRQPIFNTRSPKKQYEQNILIDLNHTGKPIKSKFLSETTNKVDQGQKQKQQPTVTIAMSEHEQPKEIVDDNNNNQVAVDSCKLINQAKAAAIDPTKTYLPLTSKSLAGYEKNFRIRTSNRRHLDFDDEYDLGDVNSQKRSRWAKPFHFIQGADSQFGMIDSYTYGKTEPGWEEEIKLCRQLVDICNQMEPKPEFLIICGDLVDALPGTQVRKPQVIDFKRIFSQLDCNIPLVCVCGNHDVGDEPTSSSIQDYRENFGDDYFYFTKNDVLFIVINSQFYQHRENVIDYAQQQDEWLESLLSKCKLFKYSIIFEHIPWFLDHFDEENDYFNINKQVRLKWLRKFHEAGVTKVMCGHYHRNAGGWYENMELVVTSAIGAQCGKDRSGVRIVKLLDDTIEHKYYAIDDIPKKIEFA